MGRWPTAPARGALTLDALAEDSEKKPACAQEAELSPRPHDKR
jgi:hypothetical protein